MGAAPAHFLIAGLPVLGPVAEDLGRRRATARLASTELGLGLPARAGEAEVPTPIGRLAADRITRHVIPLYDPARIF